MLQVAELMPSENFFHPELFSTPVSHFHDKKTFLPFYEELALVEYDS